MKIRNIGVIGLVGISLWAAAASGGSSSSSNNSGSQIKIGQPAADGKFTFTLTSVTCGIPTVGDVANGIGATAQGQFCKVTIGVKNTGSESQAFSSSDQYAFDSTGKKFTDSTEATIAAGVDQNILTGINPGNSISTDMYYDIPAGDSIAKFEFHDSPFSGGVTVYNK